jgi:hypothetical protein
MKKVLTVGLALLLVTVASLAVVGGVSAQGPQDVPAPQGETVWGRALGHVRAGMGVMVETISELLGLTPEEIHEERLEGKTLAEIANEQGITDEALIEAIVSGRVDAIEEALAEGNITQEQADWLIAKAEAMAPFQITNPFAPNQVRNRVLNAVRGRIMRGGMGRFGECPALPIEP